MAERSYIVYKHTSPSGKVYIGITSRDVRDRWNSGYGYIHQPHFDSAIKKYGWDNIKHEVLLSGLTKEEAEQKEIELIALYKSNQREFGYNKATGGRVNKGWTLSDETKKKMSSTRK